jgi:hypothetical protein
MSRRTLPWLAVAAALSGCPIPQPLPDYPAGTVTPPRIVVDRIASSGTVVRVPAGCPSHPTFDLNATLIDVNTLEVVRARWFVNYDPKDLSFYPPKRENDIPGSNANPPVTERTVPTFTFDPYASIPTIEGTGGGSGQNQGAMHVVELVVSNGFDPGADPGDPVAALPYRTPLRGFETQVYRWMFYTACAPGAPGCTLSCP